MATLIVLDASPLWLVSKRPGISTADDCRAWMSGLVGDGHTIIVPEIADYEVRREFLRQKATANLSRLNGLKARYDYRPITTDAMLHAAEFWARLRMSGLPTAGPDSLDADAILAGQASVVGQPGDAVIIATTNRGHLMRFPGIDAREWATIS